jgi:YtkA-like
MNETRRLVVGVAALALAGGLASAAASGAGATAHRVTTETVGPGPVTTTVRAHGYRIELALRPNRATVAGRISLALSRNGKPVSGARVRLTFTMLDMGGLTGLLPQTAAGRYGNAGPILGMSGRWGLRFDITPRHVARFSVNIVDRIGA